jgi:TrmH family RNA methyltransferase
VENKPLSKNNISYLKKFHQKKFRDKESKFLIEGKHLIEECLNSEYYSGNIEYAICSNDYSDNELLNLLKGKQITLKFTSKKNILYLSETETPQGILALVQKIDLPEDNDFENALVLDRISDPGNLGTILRTCWWFDIKNIILSDGCADIYNSKVIRSSQGALFNLNIQESNNISEKIEILYKSGFKIFLTTSYSAENITECNYKADGKNIFVFGNETSGIDGKLLTNKNYKKIKINSFSDCESLNVSSAVAAVIGYYKLINLSLPFSKENK